MSSFNKVILMGKMTRDVELRYTPGGMAVADIGLAINDRRKDASGQWVDDTTFVDVTLFGRTAEVASEYTKKGSPILIEGRLKLDQWNDKNTGDKRSKLKVVADNLRMLGGKEKTERQPEQRGESPPARQPQGDVGGDDIPF